MAETKTIPVKIKPNSQIAPSKSKITDSSSSLSKNLPSSNKMKSVTTVTKSEVKSKPTTMSSSSSKTTTTTKTTKRKTTTTKVRERKVYSLPGQKHDPPEEKEPLRIFYESLSKQIPTSEMAEFWLMEHGLLSLERAKKAFDRKQRKQKELRSGTPAKSSKPPTKTTSSQKPQPRPNNTGSTEKPQPRPNNTGSAQKPQQKLNNGDIKAKRKIESDSDDDDDDFILSHKRRRV